MKTVAAAREHSIYIFAFPILGADGAAVEFVGERLFQIPALEARFGFGAEAPLGRGTLEIRLAKMSCLYHPLHRRRLQSCCQHLTQRHHLTRQLLAVLVQQSHVLIDYQNPQYFYQLMKFLFVLDLELHQSRQPIYQAFLQVLLRCCRLETHLHFQPYRS